MHKVYAHFFGDMVNQNSKPKFTSSNFEVIHKYINDSQIIKDDNKNFLTKKFEELKKWK